MRNCSKRKYLGKTGNFGVASFWLIFPALSANAAESAGATAGGTAQTIGQWFKSFPATLLLEAALVLAALLVLWKLLPLIKDFLASQLQLSIFLRPSPDIWPKTLSEDEEFSKFVLGFQAVPEKNSGNGSPAGSRAASAGPAEAPTNGPVVKVPSLEDFFASAPEMFFSMQTLCDKMNRLAKKPDQRDILSDLSVKVQHLRAKAHLLELRAVWQVACALEGLLKQLTDRVSNITASTLHTVTGGVELLRDMCSPQVKADFVTNPPIRILAVDDDAVSRFAITCAIKKAFEEPDLAENGIAALKLTAERAYEMIFLDVRMPGMDGFELCSQIRETALNRGTPVVFVTSMSDFESWAQSTISGGNDLIAKPFLSFEITVKVLTFVLRARLKALGIGVQSATPAVEAVAWPAPPLPDSTSFIKKVLKKEIGPGAVTTPSPVPAKQGEEGSKTADSPKNLATVLATASVHLEEIRTQLPLLSQTTEEDAIRELLVSIYYQALSLAHKIDVPELRPAFELCTVLEGLLKKIRQNPKNLKESTLNTVVTAVDLLKDLCVEGIPKDLATRGPVRILVVDDDPIGRRAILGALQTSFFRPDGAEGGNAALALITEKTFDVVFLDVQMPDLDGFSVCRKIRETPMNRNTPVVFVTGNAGAKWREEAKQCGGSDYVVKPFPFIEITVKALTFVLRGRLQKFKATVETPVAQSATTAA
jgi:CheY-like chemotaxis protein